MSLRTSELAEAGGLLAGRYRLVAPVGRGGPASVGRAVDEVLDREVAVKQVRVPLAVPDEDRDELRQRTLREARNAARLRHPAAITVYDVFEQDACLYLVMECVASRSLRDVVSQDGAVPAERVAGIGLAVLGALRTAHEAGVLHRDVKPDNVLLGDDGRVVLTDFGIARFEGDTRL